MLPYGYSYKASHARAERQECPDVKNYKWCTLNPVWHRMLYVILLQQWATGVKELIQYYDDQINI